MGQAVSSTVGVVQPQINLHEATGKRGGSVCFFLYVFSDIFVYFFCFFFFSFFLFSFGFIPHSLFCFSLSSAFSHSLDLTGTRVSAHPPRPR